MEASTGTITIKMKDIIRLFFKYDIDALPLLDKKDKFKGFINKDIIIQDATDSEYIDKPFSKFIGKYLSYPDEEKFLFFVSSLVEDFKFPVIDIKGELLFLWDKKKLLNSYYNISKKENAHEQSDEQPYPYKEVLNILPFNILMTDPEGEIFFINKRFLKDFDFEDNILPGQKLNKIFPNINMILAKQNFFPKIFNITYRHLKWYYIILKSRTTYIYIFSKAEEQFKMNEESQSGSVDSTEIKSNKKVKAKQESPKKPASLPKIIENKETGIIKKILQENNWNITKAARILNIPRQTLQYKISKYKIS